jgi:murein DD-endopeptidase MepM/ murein hydrolase activator NlpD
MTNESPEPSPLARLWADLEASGWRDALLRYASHALMLLVLAGAIWAGQLNLQLLNTLAAKVQVQIPTAPLVTQSAGEAASPLVTALPADLIAPVGEDGRLSRFADLHTLIPTRGRQSVITYTVQKGDTLFGIADKYSLKPETILWGNYFTLKDDPHLLFPGQVLNILPIDGTYHYVSEGNTLEQIARFYGIEPQEIVDWIGNRLDPDKPTLTAGAWLVIPGGHRELQSWQLPNIDRSTTSSRTNNFGQCPGGYTGAIGDGVFVWPTDNHTLSGYDYTSIHHGLDIRARLDSPIYAVDNGVVVYAGWNDFGYGNLVVIDHGNGWTSVYGHLSQWNVSCGASVFRGNLIGLAGSTGHSSGAHLHFELKFNGGHVNPWNVLP